MQFRTLENTPIKTIAEAFSKAFEDYAINMYRTEEQMAKKIKTESIDLPASAGVFDNDNLAGFILFGMDYINDIKTAWDGGTGVLPTCRGQKLTQRMFEYILPKMKANGVQQILLEVLESNSSAFKIYEGLGFKSTRKLLPYTGTAKHSKSSAYKAEVIHDYNADTLLAMAGWQPAWQQMNNRVKGWGNAIKTIVIKDSGNIAAYAHYNPATKRIFQFAVDKKCRRRGMATALFNYICKEVSPVSVVNIDEQSKDTLAFLEATGLTHFISQYEMKREL